MNAELKSLLLQLVAEVESLRANQAVLDRASGVRLTIAEAQDTKNLALQGNRATFDKLRKQIEALA